MMDCMERVEIYLYSGNEQYLKAAKHILLHQVTKNWNIFKRFDKCVGMPASGIHALNSLVQEYKKVKKLNKTLDVNRLQNASKNMWDDGDVWRRRNRKF
jgi:predicted HNH restriction endonuclease